MLIEIQRITNVVDDEYLNVCVEASYDLAEKMTELLIISGRNLQISNIVSSCGKFRHFCQFYKKADVNYLQQIWNPKITIEYTPSWLFPVGFEKSAALLGGKPYFNYLMRAVKAINKNWRKRTFNWHM